MDNWELNRSDVWYTKRFLSNVLRILDTTSKAGEVGCQALSPDTPERGEGGAMTIHGLPVKIDPTLPPGAWYIETEDGQRIHPPPDAGGEGV